ncbi:MAG TPA: SIS domain-containing protein [Candidatus Rubrimentiphilum sp.]|nr:SIS domain-containing protein [Candidatus Rubrimentiphilum sp.]
MSSFTREYLAEAAAVLEKLDGNAIDAIIGIIADATAKGGRIFFLGIGGSAANASHAVNDFRKIAGLEAYAPTDNIAELTARANDDGWDTIFAAWLRGSRLTANDVVFVLSVSGGDTQKNISLNIVSALQYAREVGSKIVGIVGRESGYTSQVADACVVIPVVNPERVTPHSEAFQPLVWHLMVFHPSLKRERTTWESDS